MTATVTPVPVPAASRVHSFYPVTNLADAFAVALPLNATRDPERLARFLFSQQPTWVGQLMKVRDALVAGFGLKTAKQLAADTEDGTPHQHGAARPQRVGIFRIYERHDQEIILGEDDSHLNFRVSVRYHPAGESGADRSSPPQVVVSTVVQCHNLLGRCYIALIAPFHRQVVRAHLQRAARAGWPSA